MDRPTFLKFSGKWVNLGSITHVEIDETTKTASVYFGSNAITKSKEAYNFFKAEDPAYFFTKACT